MLKLFAVQQKTIVIIVFTHLLVSIHVACLVAGITRTDKIHPKINKL